MTLCWGTKMTPLPLQSRLHICGAAPGRAQYHEPLFRGQRGIANPCRRVVRASTDNFAQSGELPSSCLPCLGFDQVQIDVRVRCGRGLQAPEGLRGAVRGGGDIGVIRKGVELLALGETGARHQEGPMHTDRILTRHQWVSLFASVGLLDGVGTSVSIIVEVCVLRATKRGGRTG